MKDVDESENKWNGGSGKRQIYAGQERRKEVVVSGGVRDMNGEGCTAAFPHQDAAQQHRRTISG